MSNAPTLPAVPLADDAAAERNVRTVCMYVRGKEDWLDLALAALDQAGLPVSTQEQIWTIVGRTE